MPPDAAVRPRGPAAVLLLLLVTAAASCLPRASTLPEAFTGRWYHTSVGGGIDGEAGGATPSGHIVISSGEVAYHDDEGSLVRTVPHTAMRGPTIFSTDDQWILDRGDAPQLVLWVSEDGESLTLSENVYDGIGNGYQRTR